MRWHGALSGVIAAIPAAGVAGRYYWATDARELFRDTGAVWEPVPATGIWNARIGAWFWSMMYTRVLTSNDPPAANRLWAIPWPQNRTSTYDEIAIDVQTGEAARSAYLGIYEDNGSGYPGDLVVDAGAVAVAAAGMATIAFGVAEQLTQRNLYWLVHINNAVTGTLRVYSDPGYVLPILGHDATLHQNARSAGVWVAQAYGALPDPFPAGGTYHEKNFAMGLKLSSVP